jgi:GNAT superfamily N-acetyltransferase
MTSRPGYRRPRGGSFRSAGFTSCSTGKRTEWVNVNGLGLLPQYRGLGANAMLYTELRDTIASHGFKHIDTVQANETNFNSTSDHETLGVEWYKRHRHYKLTL